MTQRLKNTKRNIQQESIREASSSLFLGKQQITNEHEFSEALLEKSLNSLLALFSQTEASRIAENLTHSQLRADDSPKLTSTLAICVYEQPGKDRIAKAREILEWELAYASARQRLTANVRALLNLCILSRTENTEFDRDLAFSTIQEKLEVLEARLQSAGKNVERNRVLLAKNLLEAEYLIEKGLCYKSRNHHEEALTFFKQALQPAFVGAELGFRKWLLTSLKWTALGEMEAKRWLQATVYFADYCGRCLFHIEEVVLQQNTPAVYSEAKNHVEKSNAEPRSQLKYFIPGDFVDSFLNLCECLFHLRLYDEANFCVNYISPVALAVDDEEITSRHFELKMNINDSINREKRKTLASEDEDWDSEFGSIDTEELHPRFSNLFGDKFFQSRSDKDHKLNLLKEQIEVRSSFASLSSLIKYPKPTVLYSLRLPDGRMQLHETEFESWLLHYSFTNDRQPERGPQKETAPSSECIPGPEAILDRLKRLDQVTVEWAEMYFLLIWDAFREKKLSLISKYADTYFGALHAASSELNSTEKKENTEKLFQLSMEIEDIVRNAIKFPSTNASKVTVTKHLDILESSFPSMTSRIHLYKVQARGHYELENGNSTSFLDITKNFLEIQRACCNREDVFTLVLKNWESIDFDDITFSTKDLELQLDAIASLYLLLCQRSPLTGKQMMCSDGYREVIPRRKDFQGLMKKFKLQYEYIPNKSRVKAKTAFVLAHYGFHSTGDKTTAERQLFESLVLWKQYASDHLEHPTPLLVGETLQVILDFFSNILSLNGKAIYSLAATTAEHAAHFFITRSTSIPIMLRCVRISQVSGLYPFVIVYLLQILETYLVLRDGVEFMSCVLHTIDAAIEFGYFSCALELIECGITYIQESTNANGKTLPGRDESKDVENRHSFFSLIGRMKVFEELKIRTGIILICTGYFHAAEKLFRQLSLQSRDHRVTALGRLYLTEIYYRSNRHCQCLKVCEQLERMTSFRVSQLLENVRLSFQLTLWDLELKISEAAIFMKVRSLSKQKHFTEALKNIDFAFIKFHRGQLRHLSRLYYLRGKILTQMMIHLKGDVNYQSSHCYITCFIAKTERLVGPRTIQITSQGAQSMERKVEWQFSVENKEDLISQALDSLFRSINYFKKIGQEWMIAKAQLCIGKLINAYLVTQVTMESDFKWIPLKNHVRDYLKFVSKIESAEEIHPDRILISACKTWKGCYSLRELLSGYITLVEYYCLTGYSVGASYLFHECWLLLSELFLTDLNKQSCVQLKTGQSVEYVIKILSKMAWILVTFFSREEAEHYLFVLDALNNLKLRYYEMQTCREDDDSKVTEDNYSVDEKHSDMHFEGESIEQYSIVDITSADVHRPTSDEFLQENLESRANSIWSFLQENEPRNPSYLSASQRRLSVLQEEQRNIYEVGKGTRKLLSQGEIRKLVYRVSEVYPVDISSFTEEKSFKPSSHSTCGVFCVNQLYHNSWSIFHHLKLLICQYLRGGKWKGLEECSRLNWRGWVEWLGVARSIRKKSPHVYKVPKELVMKSLFICYFDRFLLLYAPCRQIQYSIPLYPHMMEHKLESPRTEKELIPIPSETVKILKGLVMNEEERAFLGSFWYHFLERFQTKKRCKSRLVEILKHMLSSSMLHSLLHQKENGELSRDSPILMFVDPDIAFVPWEFMLDICAVRCGNCNDLVQSKYMERLEKDSTTCIRPKICWFDEKVVRKSFLATNTNTQKKQLQQLEKTWNGSWKLVSLNDTEGEEEDWIPWQGPFPLSLQPQTAAWLEKKWKDGKIQVASLCNANAFRLLRFYCPVDGLHIACFLCAMQDGLPLPWTTWRTFLERLPLAISLFVPTKYMEDILSLELFQSIEYTNKPLSIWIQELLAAAKCFPIFIYVNRTTAIKYCGC